MIEWVEFDEAAGTELFDGEEADRRRAEKLESHVRELGFKIDRLQIDVEGRCARIEGKAGSQEAREKTVLAVGNTVGIARVLDRLHVARKRRSGEATYYMVKKGDTLSKIALEHYGSGVIYPLIFEANRPLLERPDGIYPGQVLRIPLASG